jgi:hypothetical protein
MSTSREHVQDMASTDRRRRGRRKAMFLVETRQGGGGRVVIVGRASRKQATTFVNVPASQEFRKRLDEQIVGSLAMGTSALLEWALDELKRQGITVEAHPKP